MVKQLAVGSREGPFSGIQQDERPACEHLFCMLIQPQLLAHLTRSLQWQGMARRLTCCESKSGAELDSREELTVRRGDSVSLSLSYSGKSKRVLHMHVLCRSASNRAACWHCDTVQPAWYSADVRVDA